MKVYMKELEIFLENDCDGKLKREVIVKIGGSHGNAISIPQRQIQIVMDLLGEARDVLYRTKQDEAGIEDFKH